MSGLVRVASGLGDLRTLDMFAEDDQATNVVEEKARDWKNAGQPFKIRELIETLPSSASVIAYF